MRRLPFFKPQPLQWITLGGFTGVNDFADPVSTPDGYLTAATNVRFDRGVARPRPGFGLAYDLSALTSSPLNGMGTWRLAQQSGADEVRRAVMWGKKTEGASTVGALFADLDGTLTDVTPEEDGASRLVETDQAAFFAQLNNKLYGVNGWDGILVYDGKRGSGDQAYLARAMDELPAPVLSKAFGSLRPEGGYSWTAYSPSGGTLTLTAVTYDPMHPKQTPTAEAFHLESSVADTTGDWVYHKFASSVDLTAEEYAGDHLFIRYQCNKSGVPLRLWIGSTDAADATTDPADASFAPSSSNAFYWDLVVDRADTAIYQRLPLDGVPDDIRENIDYIVFECINTTVTGGIGALLGTGVTAWIFQMHGLFAPGDLPDGLAYYRQVAYDSEEGINGPPSPVSQIELYAGKVGSYPYTDRFEEDLCRRVKVTVDFTEIDAAVDRVDVYRAYPEQNVTEPEGLLYYLVGSALRENADGDGVVTIYDAVSEDELADPANRMPYDRSPAAFNLEAPWFIAGTGTRLLYARSDNHPNRVWASDIGYGASVTDMPFADHDDAGRGGWFDVGADDGDEIMGIVPRVNETLILKRENVWAWTRVNEGGSKDNGEPEIWRFDPITRPGCIASRSICRIPGGVGWAARDGYYVLFDHTDHATPEPLSLPVQETWDAIPDDYRHLIACAYDPTERLLFIAYPEPGETQNTALLVYDFRNKAWAHKWESAVLSPKFLFSDFVNEGDDKGRYLLYAADGTTGKVMRLKDPTADATPYGDESGGAQTDVACSVVTKWLTPKVGSKTRPARRLLEFTHEEQSAGDSALRMSDLSLALEARSGGGSVTLDDYEDYVSFPSEGPNGNVIYGTGTDGYERIGADDRGRRVAGMEHRATVRWTHDGDNADDVRLAMARIGFADLGEWR